MIKTQYQKELVISATQSVDGSTNTKKDTLKVQSWLNLFAMNNPSAGTATGIDGDFGAATEKAFINYQKANNIRQTGMCDQAMFNQLSKTIRDAFTKTVVGNDLRTLVVNVANQHLNNAPFELVINGQSNCGPWVRAYMDGLEGTPQFWCMGFVQTIIDQACSQLNKDFRILMPVTFSCDTIGTTGLRKGLLSRFSVVRNNPQLVKPGDIFLLQKTPNDWMHTGLITAIHEETFDTIEGNTNTDGSSNGNGVYKRVRNFRQSKLDVFSIEPLV
jgi:peptidoglycan hydrolase-like protein with peptidoglycan-binding domain